MTELTNPVRRRTVSVLDGSFGCDRNRALCVSLNKGDTITLWPKGTRQKETVHLLDVYRFAMRCRANRIHLEKARLKKERKAIRLSNLRQQRAEKRLTALARQDVA